MRFCDFNTGIAQDEAIHVTAPTLVCFSVSSCRGILSLLKNSCFRIDRIARREQERQRRRNIQQLLAKDLLEVPVKNGVYKPKAALPKDWDTRWIEIPCVDVILTSSPDQDGTRWDSEWPGAFVTRETTRSKRVGRRIRACRKRKRRRRRRRRSVIYVIGWDTM